MYENWLLITAYAGLFLLIIAILHKLKRESEVIVTKDVNGRPLKVGMLVKMRYGRAYERRIFRIRNISLHGTLNLLFIGGKEGKANFNHFAIGQDVKAIE